MRLSYWIAALGAAYPAWRALNDVIWGEFYVLGYWPKKALLTYLYSQELKSITHDNITYSGRFVIQDKENIGEIWELVGHEPRMFRLPSGIPIWVSDTGKCPVKGRDGETIAPDAPKEQICVIYPKMLINPDQLLKDAMLYMENIYESGYKLTHVMITSDGHKESYEGSFKEAPYWSRPVLLQQERIQKKNSLTLEDIPASPDQELIVRECTRWYESKKWYESRRLPYRRGYLLYGPPGTGKTTFVRALGKELNLTILQFDLSTFDNNSLRKSWRLHGKDHDSKIILLEDLDAVFNGRENVSSGYFSRERRSMVPSLSWDCLLSVIDSLDDHNGTLLFITTNFPEKLDPSLANVMVNEKGNDVVKVRPGRIDRAVRFDTLNFRQSSKVAESILGDECEALDLCAELRKDGKQLTVAEVQEACVNKVMKDYWNKENYGKKEN